MLHTFHIPVLGLGYSIDTPLKVARYGISSVLSIVDDELIERMRQYHTEKSEKKFTAIPKHIEDSRSKRITAYLNFLKESVEQQFEQLKEQDFIIGNDLCRYFELLPEHANLKHGYELMMAYPEGESKRIFQKLLRNGMKMGAIDVNIMAKVDKMNFLNKMYTGDLNTDALAALRGFAESSLQASVVLSAGMNPRLYSYLAEFADFFPDEAGALKKKVILKVSDFRSAFIQTRFLAKKGIWVSEFRIESGLNCGGHAFATEGHLLGPILEEFKAKRSEMVEELLAIYQTALESKNIFLKVRPAQRITVQGGIGTAEEHQFLLQHYGLAATGWGSPFLLVPEVTNVDQDTLAHLAAAKTTDYYLSNASPLGVLFNNFKHSSIEQQKQQRIVQGRPGSPCTKKYLCTNTEFTTAPICTASREYQNLKIKQLQSLDLTPADYQARFNEVTEKICLCEGLCSSAYLKYEIVKPRENKAVAICPGPNLAYFSGVYSFDQLIGHIYGRESVLQKTNRPNMFVQELNLYIKYFQGLLAEYNLSKNDKKRKQLLVFKNQLLAGVDYYKTLFKNLSDQAASQLQLMAEELSIAKDKLDQLMIG
ncbi:hypothetical protein [Pedobacter rhizosphaerae]|uniref:Uncharacterized protein n=1 Tax=Pedobacter rhizosphaerae TaxID=390241 RepID=A0A1H9UUE4_9SPHI|nr:hypothetical protein [Pedobacter rhizosphaerae]SES13042.1 hypothetical protein SAMN04488023_13415 [Pedobacter rhizosphaerae]